MKTFSYVCAYIQQKFKAYEKFIVLGGTGSIIDFNNRWMRT
jgi:hypothetical protein